MLKSRAIQDRVDFIIRPACSSDGRAIRGLVWRARLNPFCLRWHNFMVAEVAGQVVACMQVRSCAGVREVASVVVHPSFQGQGIGSALNAHMLGRERGDVYGFCDDKMVSYYYRKFGFIKILGRQAPVVLRVRLFVANYVLRPITRRPKAVIKRARKGSIVNNGSPESGEYTFEQEENG